MNKQLRFFMIGLLLVGLLAAGTACKTTSSGGQQSAAPAPAPNVQKDVEEIDTQIAKVDDEIRQTRDFLREQNITLIGALGGGIGPQGMHENPYEARDTIIIMTSANIRVAEQRLDELRRQRKDLENQKASALNQAASCFPADVLIRMGNGELRRINELRSGDVILTLDIGSNENKKRQIISAYESANNHYYLINGDLRVTGGERFLTSDGWKTARNLKPGDSIMRESGMKPIQSIELIQKDLQVYNLQVDKSHTFYVTAGGEAYLVHNTSGGGGGGGSGGGGDGGK